MYKNIGKSIYSKKFNCSSDTILFLKKVPSIEYLYKQKRKRKRNKKNVSHKEIIDLLKYSAYINPKSFTNIYHN